jgi:hypothetical protein
MTKERGTDPHRRFLQIGLLVAALASFGGLASMVRIAIENVQSGHGLDTYRTIWLVEFNWIGFLILLAALVVAVGIALLFRLKEHREVQQLRKKYGEGRHG